MSYYVYITETCTNDAKQHTCIQNLNKVKNRIEINQNIANFDRFLPSPNIRVRLPNNLRMIASNQKIYLNNNEIVNVVCFLKILSRSSNEYKNKFLNNSKSFNNLIPSDDTLRNYVQEKIDNGNNVVNIPEMSKNEEIYLFSYSDFQSDDDFTIYETSKWVEKFSIDNYSDLRETYNKIIIRILDDDNNHDETRLNCLDDSSNGIIYKYSKELKSLLLISPINRVTTDAEISEIEKIYDKFLSNNFSSNDIIRVSRKSYPSYVIYGWDEWIGIQKNNEGNLALSPEEIGIINSIKASNNERKYPLFINGRAGSGKTTILLYLFADMLASSIKNNTICKPLYLTYNESLLEVAKTTVSNIISCNPKYEELNNKINNEYYNSCFYKFRNFLLNILKDNSEKVFDEHKFIDYSKFSSRFNKHFRSHPNSELRTIGPEIPWHTIKTYIKGMSSSVGNYFDKESYETELPSNLKTIENNTYKLVYDEIWEGWYKPLCEQAGFWDDQDITREVLDLDIDISNYLSVFCDESQDFTSNELELIFNLNLYTKRNIPCESLKNIPFAFAGDPFQTLNPTGFNWTNVKANFYRKIVQELDRYNVIRDIINYNELSFNYRSCAAIVKFCNLIQLLRGVLFNLSDLKPQETWFDNDGTEPVFFYNNNPFFENAMRDQAELVIIIPCKEGEEAKFAKNDPFLRTFAIENDKNDNPILIRNIMSPVRAKGLEFKRIVLYKFGEEAYSKFGNDSLLKECNDENSLSYHYFINALYVAASRPKNRLFIVDTSKGEDTLWSLMSNNDKIDDIWLKYHNICNNNYWDRQKHISSYIRGNDNININEDRDDPKEIAEMLKEHGISNKNPYEMRMAAHNYNRIGKSNDYLECLALAEEFEENYDKAADYYISINSWNKAVECLWYAKKYKKILDLENDYPDLKSHFEFYASEYIFNKSNPVIFLNRFYEKFQNNPAFFNKIILCKNSQWIDIISGVISRIKNEYENDLDIEWQKIKVQIEFLKEKGIEIVDSVDLAFIYFKTNDYNKAVNIWEEKYSNNHNDYYIAKSKVEEYPDNLSWLGKINSYNEIISCFNSNISNDRFKLHKLSIEIQKIIIDAFINENKFSMIYDDLEKYFANFNFEMKKEIIKYFALDEQWLKISSLIEKNYSSSLFNNLDVRNYYYKSVIINKSYNSFFQTLYERETIDYRTLKYFNNQENKIGLKILYSIFILQKIKKYKFKEALEYLNFENPDAKDFENCLVNNKKLFIQCIFYGLSQFEHNINERNENNKFIPNEDLIAIQNFTNEYFFENRNYNDFIDEFLAGKINEVINRHKDMIKFYENLKKNSDNPNVINFAKEREIIANKKYMDYLNKKLSDNFNDTERENKVNDLFNSLGTDKYQSVMEIPYIPDIKPDNLNFVDDSFILCYLKNINEQIENYPVILNINDSHDFNINDIKYTVKYDSNRNRIRILNDNRDENISYFIDENSMRGEPNFHELEDNYWFVKDWQVNIKVNNFDEKTNIEIFDDNSNFVFQW